jgi:ABC-type multidrug transport system permease subunit
MCKNLCFLKVSSVVVKVVAWIFLCLGLLGSVSLFLGKIPGSSRWMGFFILAVYGFIFFFFFLIAKMADLLVQIISTGSQSSCGGNEINKE